MASNKLIAIIAGVGPGTGAAIARKFAQSYPVVLLARNPDNFSSLVSEINGNNGTAIGISTDVSSAESVRNAFGEVEKKFGKGVGAAVSWHLVGFYASTTNMEIPYWRFRTGRLANDTRTHTGGSLQRQRRLQTQAVPGTHRSGIHVRLQRVGARRVSILASGTAAVTGGSGARKHASAVADLHGRDGVGQVQRADEQLQRAQVCAAGDECEFGQGVWTQGRACGPCDY